MGFAKMTCLRVRFFCWGALVLLFVLFLPCASAQAATRHIGTYDDWNAWTDGEGRKQVCFVSSQPLTSEGNYTRRGAVFLIVSASRAAPNGEVSYTAGYRYKKATGASLTIDEATYELGFTQGEVAWSLDRKQDRRIIQGFRSGLKATVEALSWRDTTTIDEFSLKGFSSAWRSALEACPF
ncbi:MAG: hypothetical protein GDA50_00470 [Alphaproteobacteria bacterium GM202ARS2]|nr:hypothetical protein [Alphaproteobacteria bacterium GM202ARS2]